jgi:hypothetical protein
MSISNIKLRHHNENVSGGDSPRQPLFVKQIAKNQAHRDL